MRRPDLENPACERRLTIPDEQSMRYSLDTRGNKQALVCLAFVVLVSGPQPAAGTDGATPAYGAARPTRVHNLKILSDQIDDVTTSQNILRSFLKPAMTQAERCEALWRATVKYRHQTAPPNEFLAADWETHDPVKLFNVYGYCMCCCSSAVIEALNRLDGRETRGRILNGHSVPEVRFDDEWHMYDASLITYFPKPDGGLPASVDEISQAVGDWYALHPGYQRQPPKLLEVMRADGWMGWKSTGPKLLANCPFYRLGYFPARTHGWDATMQEYDRKCEVYEYGYQLGHRALVSLRPGESYVREAGNRGWHVNMHESPDWDGLRATSANNDMEYLREFFPQYHGGLVGNGFHRYAPDLASGGLAAGAERFENLKVGSAATASERPIVQRAEGGKPGVVVIPLTSPYVYLGGRLSLKAWRQSAADSVRVSLSTNNARTFQPIWSAEKTGSNSADVDLSPHIFRRYAYWIKIELGGASAAGTGLSEFSIENRLQHAPRTLPFLSKGKNKLTVSVDGDPTIATRTVTGRLAAEPGFSKNETSETMGVTFENIQLAHGGCWWQGGTGAITVPVDTPGEIVALRFGGHIRARGQRDLVKIQVSFDDGQTWQEAGRIAGPTQGRTEYFRFDKIPPGAMRARLRYEMTGNNTVGVLSFRVDADYRDPAASGFQPFEIVHRWREGAEPKERHEMVNRLPYHYQMTTAAEPEMLSVEYRMPQSR